MSHPLPANGPVLPEQLPTVRPPAFRAAAEGSPIQRLRVTVLEAWALWVALEVGLFERLVMPKALSSLATELGFDVSALRPLLEALCVTGYLERPRPDEYVLLSGRSAYVLENSPAYVGPSFGFLRTARWFEQYPELLRRGGGLSLPDEVWAHAVRGSSAYVAPALRAMLAGVPGLRADPLRVLDVGCGQGDYAAALAQQNPGLRILAIDPTPYVATLAKERLARFGAVEVRCSTVDEVEGEFDVVLLNHVIHVVGAREGTSLIRSCAARLATDGSLLVQELLETDANGGALFGLMMRLLFPEGEVLGRIAFDQLFESLGLRHETLMTGEGGSGLLLVRATVSKGNGK